MGVHPRSETFNRNIHQYNTAFAFTSLGAKIDCSVLNGTGPYAFRVSGELTHRMGALLPEPGQTHSYAQLYIHDPAVALGIRQNTNPNLDPIIMTDLQAMLNDCSPYVPLYKHKQAFLIMRQRPPEEQTDIGVRLHLSEGTDQRRYNLPTAGKIAAVIPGDGTEDNIKTDRDIILRMQGGGLRRISQINPLYSPLHYVLLFPKGELGWGPDLELRTTERSKRTSQTQLTQAMYTAYRIHPRIGDQDRA
ncbi:hypothetical protein BDZ89DRAFT_253112, partial [Hymenopellis radicata]